MDEELASLWSNQESVDDLKNKLLCVSWQLESARMEANEEIRKNKEAMKQLVHLLKTACQERDEARDQLNKLLQTVMPASPPELYPTPLPNFEPETPLLKPHKANSSITESNSLSDNHNHHSHGGSSPVESFFDAVSSPDFSNINVGDSSNMVFVNQPFVQDYNVCPPADFVPQGMGTKFDQASEVIDSLTKGRALPPKGRLLQAVMEAGPLLQTLFVAGPLPQWRNPPPPQPLKVPPVSINQKANASLRPMSSSSSTYLEMSCGTSHQMIANSMLDFTSGLPGSCLTSMPLLGSGANFSTHIPSSKRMRFQ